MIPDSEMRARAAAELRKWSCDYLLSSEDMRGEAERARSLGWSVLEDPGNHLDVVNRATEVAANLVRISGRRVG
jgi:hypothetical protein